MNGLDLCRVIREKEEWASVKILMMSGVYRKDQFAQEAEDVGADDFLEKPIDLPTLKQMIHHYLGQ